MKYVALICYVIAGLIVGLALFGLLFFGAAWISEKVLPALTTAGAVYFFALVVLFLPLSFLGKFRRCSAWAFIGWSYLCGVCLWMSSLLVALNLWGIMAVIIGLLMGGIGVVPVAGLACMFKGEWSLFFQLLLQFILLMVARGYGFYLLGKVEYEVIDS